MQLITSLQVRSQLVLWSCGVRSWREAEDRALLVEQLDLLPRAFPNLQRLEWIPSPEVYSHMYIHLDELDEAERLLLGPLFRVSARMPAVQLVVPLPDCLFFSVATLEQRRPAPRQDLLGQKLGDIRMWYPFTEHEGESEPDGGGFWIVYGEEVKLGQKYDGTFFGQSLH